MIHEADLRDAVEREFGTPLVLMPYGRTIGKALAAVRRNSGVTPCLVPARMDTAWWWDHCRHGEIRFLRGRVRFAGQASGAPFPSALVVFGLAPRVGWWDVHDGRADLL
jgi:hypothetical protein